MAKAYATIVEGLTNLSKKLRLDPEDGVEQKVNEDALSAEKQLEDARAGVGALSRLDPGTLAKYVRKRWDRLEPDAKKIQTELKVNFARYKGFTFAQPHPTDPNRIYMPTGTKQRLAPTINKIRRAVHRYVAQVTADEPILEGVPESHNDTARDAAEAATQALRGEWYRLNLHRHLQKVAMYFSVVRSGFWLFEWDDTAGGRTPAQKFFMDEKTGEQILDFADKNGNRTTEDNAALIWQGNTVVETLSPMNVRWYGSEYAHEADEVFVGKVITLRQLYAMEPKTRDAKLSQLLGGVPPNAREWLSDMRGTGGTQSASKSTDDETDLDGHKLPAESSRLDQDVFLLYYFRPASREYKDGYQCLVAGKHLVHQGALRYGVIPVVQFKMIDDLQDPLGLSLVDLLRDPQELLDFVNTQVLKFLQGMKRRWFVPLASGVKARDLLNPTRSIIHFNPNGGAPVAEPNQEIPQTFPAISDRFDAQFDDQLGMHATTQGVHVPGVTSGRHAEALRAGDETVLGLTRTQTEQSLGYAGKIMLAIIKREWTMERKTAYFDGRTYIENAFSKTDFGSTHSVRLAKGTMLMMTPAQKLETLFGYSEMGVLTPAELRKLAPISDTAGVSTTEDPYYQRARREDTKFLAGPPPELLKARKTYETEVAELNKQTADVNTAISLRHAETPDGLADSQAAAQVIASSLQQVEQAWQAELAKHMPVLMEWEKMSPPSAEIHVVEHSSTMSSDRVRRFPDWWVEPYQAHLIQTMQVLQAAVAAQAPAKPPQA